MDEREENLIEELWHNLYRMHSYVKAGGNTALIARADAVLRSSLARIELLIPKPRSGVREPLPQR